MNDGIISIESPNFQHNSAESFLTKNYRTEDQKSLAGLYQKFKLEPPINAAGACTEQLPEFDYVIPGLSAGTVGALVAPGGTGKSYFLLQLAAQICGGPDLLGIGNLKNGQVAYLSCEDPDLEIRYRIQSTYKGWAGRVSDSIFNNLLIQSLRGRKIDVMDQDMLSLIKLWAKNKRLLVLDTFRKFHSLNENSSDEMSAVLTVLDEIAIETGCAVLFLHHTSKNAGASGSGDIQQASRGSSALVDNIRWQANLTIMSKEDAIDKYDVAENLRNNFVKYNVSKQNSGKNTGDVWLRRMDTGILEKAVLEDKRGRQKINNKSELSKDEKKKITYIKGAF